MSQVLIVTGSSRGIGAATAVAAGRLGYSVCVNYRVNQEAAEKVVNEIRAVGSKAISVQADMGKEADVIDLFSTVDRELGPVTGLVNNAAILGGLQSKVEDMTAERINKMLAVNVTGCFLAAREAIKRMSRERGGKGGAIVNVSSLASRLGAANEYVDYAASKAAVDTLTIGLSKEVAHLGIRVNAVRPGTIRTDIHASGGSPDRAEKVGPLIPLQRPGEPEEIAHTILWLLSQEASYVTGAILDATGGR